MQEKVQETEPDMPHNERDFTIRATGDSGREYTIRVRNPLTQPGSVPSIAAIQDGLITLNGQIVAYIERGHYQTIDGEHLRLDRSHGTWIPFLSIKILSYKRFFRHSA